VSFHDNEKRNDIKKKKKKEKEKNTRIAMPREFGFKVFRLQLL